MSYECFEVRIADAVADVVLNRPAAMNTMNPAFWRELPAIIRELDARGDVRAIVLSSTGKHFTAGMDLAVFASGLGIPKGLEVGRQREAVRRLVLHLQDAFTAIETARMPVIAAIQGGCIGGGVDLVCACDVRVCTEDAYFVIQETNLGMVADVGTLQRMPKLVPSGIVRELAYTGRKLGAARAEKIGFVNEVHADAAATLAAAQAMAKEIASKSPLTIAGTKDALVFARDHGVPESLHYMAAWQSGMFQDADVMEAMRARVEKREPVFPPLAPGDSSL